MFILHPHKCTQLFVIAAEQVHQRHTCPPVPAAAHLPSIIQLYVIAAEHVHQRHTCPPAPAAAHLPSMILLHSSFLSPVELWKGRKPATAAKRTTPRDHTSCSEWGAGGIMRHGGAFGGEEASHRCNKEDGPRPETTHPTQSGGQGIRRVGSRTTMLRGQCLRVTSVHILLREAEGEKGGGHTAARASGAVPHRWRPIVLFSCDDLGGSVAGGACVSIATAHQYNELTAVLDSLIRPPKWSPYFPFSLYLSAAGLPGSHRSAPGATPPLLLRAPLTAVHPEQLPGNVEGR